MLKCTKCEYDIPLEDLNKKTFSSCPGCGQAYRAEVYPALFREDAASASGEKLVIDGQASCFYHKDKKASIPCSSCGRFVCTLCDIEFDGQHFCPSCFDHKSTKQDNKKTKASALQYDNIASALAYWPILIWPATIITAPLAMYITIRYWNKSTSVIPRSKLRFILAFLMALAQVLAWLILIYFLISRK
jgi:hypothetical protein